LKDESGCCAGTFLDLNEDGDAIRKMVRDACKISLPEACAVHKKLIRTLTIWNLRKDFFEAHKDQIKEKIKRDIAVSVGVRVTAVQIVSVEVTNVYVGKEYKDQTVVVAHITGESDQDPILAGEDNQEVPNLSTLPVAARSDPISPNFIVEETNVIDDGGMTPGTPSITPSTPTTPTPPSTPTPASPPKAVTSSASSLFAFASVLVLAVNLF
jgi:hypothetical protein